MSPFQFGVPQDPGHVEAVVEGGDGVGLGGDGVGLGGDGDDPHASPISAIYIRIFVIKRKSSLMCYLRSKILPSIHQET